MEPRKSRPKAALLCTQKPLVFWLDNAIPTEYRGYVSEGVLMWNKALEKIGIKDGIQVKQMPDNADGTLPICAITSFGGVLSRVGLRGRALPQQPDHGRNRQRLDHSGTPISCATSNWRKPRRSTRQRTGSGRSASPMHSRVKRTGLRIRRGMREQGWFGYNALTMLAPEMGVTSEEYMRQYLREVVCHEMGHIMGLRHNFIASTFHDDKQLSDPKTLNEDGVTASVMEYGPFNIYALKHKDVPFYSPTVGPYDLWAIGYGYSSLDSKTTDGERDALKKIASRTNEPGLAFQSDEHADSFDPAVTRFDLGKDSLAYWERSLEVSRQLMNSLGARLPLEGESYVDFTRGFNYALGSMSRSGSQIGRYIGGLHFATSFKGDPNPKPALAPIDGETHVAPSVCSRNTFSRKMRSLFRKNIS